MRLTIRVLLAAMRACEQALDEIVNALRDSKYLDQIREAQRSQRAARSTTAQLLDCMIDDNAGD